MVSAELTAAQVWAWLADVPDPEIPVLSVVDLGIVRDVTVASDGAVRVTVTPTYSGCPATRVIERDIASTLRGHGVERVELDVRIAPPWTTDWLSDEGREKLRTYGIAPPEAGSSAALDIIAFAEPSVACPRCASREVELTSRFGSTPCKALYRCNACREPFDYFKCH